MNLGENRIEKCGFHGRFGFLEVPVFRIPKPLLIEFITASRLKPAAAAVTGTLIRKEKRAASSRLRPKNSPQVIVAPERETPGTRAAACASPIPKAPNGPSFMALSVLRPTASATRNSTPTKTRLMTTTQGERTSVAKKSSK